MSNAVPPAAVDFVGELVGGLVVGRAIAVVEGTAVGDGGGVDETPPGDADGELVGRALDPQPPAISTAPAETANHRAVPRGDARWRRMLTREGYIALPSELTDRPP